VSESIVSAALAVEEAFAAAGFEAGSRRLTSVRDHTDSPPDDLVAVVSKLGAARAIIPLASGGTLTRLDSTLLATRIIARHDPAVMQHAMGSITGATVAGQLTREPWLGEVIAGVDDGRLLAFAIAERRHGGDLAATELTIADHGAGLRISGDKWIVLMGDRAETLLVVGVDPAARGPRAIRLVRLEGAEVDRARSERVALAALRGAGHATFSFRDLDLPREALVAEGAAVLEALVKGLQLVRLTSTAGSLGAADTLLRTALDFLESRGHPALAAEAAAFGRQEIAAAWSALTLADILTLVAARMAQLAPQVTPMITGAAKIVAGDAASDIGRRVTDLAGTSGFVVGSDYGVVAKLVRDVAAIRHVDTGPTRLAVQLAQNFTGTSEPPAHVREAVLRAVAFDGGDLPPLEVSSFGVALRTLDPIIAVFDDVRDDLARALTESGAWGPGAVQTLDELRAAYDHHRTRLTAGKPDTLTQVRAARSTSWALAGILAALVWRAQPERFADRGWLGPLARYALAYGAGTIDPPFTDADRDAAYGSAREQYSTNRLFSVVDLPIHHHPARGENA
jgi:alkylation response protein AidB-like acyl-CoA dehydrogenase